MPRMILHPEGDIDMGGQSNDGSIIYRKLRPNLWFKVYRVTG